MIKPFRFLLGVVVAFAAHAAFASSNGVVISQVYGGGGNSGATYKADFIEVFNGSAVAVDISGYAVQYASAAGTTWQVTNLASGTVVLQPGQYYLVQEALGAGGSVDLPTPDVTGTTALSATAGKVALTSTRTVLTGAAPSSSAIVDVVGFGSTANFFETAPTAGPANATAVIRAAAGCIDTDNNAADFTVAAPTPRSRTSTPPLPCGTIVNAPIVTSCPSFLVVVGSGGSGVVSATDPDSTVNQVSLTSAPAGISLGTFTPAPAAGGTASVPVVVSAALAAGSYPFSLGWANDQGQTATCSGTATVGAITAIYTIQGSGSTSPLVNQTVLTQGVVTRTTNNGFYMQDPQGDGNPATSDAIFVFTSTPPTAVAGNLVRVSGTVTEFNTGAANNTDTASHTITELSSVSGVTVIGTGYSIAPVAIIFPAATREDLERYEHMLVTINGPLTVAQTFFVGQYGQLTLAAQGAVESPTNRYRPGSAAQALYVSNKNRSFVLEDGTTVQNPNPTPFLGASNTTRTGDTVPAVTGVLDYGLATSSNSDPGSWRIIPTVAPVFTRANPRTTAPEDVGGTIRVGAANVLNFFTTFTNGQTAAGGSGQGCTLGNSTSASNCRGADNITEFNRQRTKIVEELSAIDADVLGIMEMQNNGSVGVQTLVDGLNAKLGAGTYAAVPDPVRGTGTDAIKVAMIYKPSRLTRVGDSVSDPSRIHNRPPLAQTFAVPGGQQFTLVVNHLKSKTCGGATGADTDQGDLQDCFNATRVLQARQTRAFVSSLSPNGKPIAALLVGDFNSLAQEDPIVEMTSNGYVDEIGRYNTFGYSYGFDGASGRLDHALSTPGLTIRVTRASEWHINSDEPPILDYNLENKQPACATCSPDLYTPTPYRASDHDPVVIGLSFDTQTIAPTRPVSPPVVTDSLRPAAPARTDPAAAPAGRLR